MLNDLYVVAENGQLEINFDALELVTSSEFVSKARSFLSLNYHIIDVDLLHGDFSDWLSIYFYDGFGYQILSFITYLTSGHTSIIESSISKYDLIHLFKLHGLVK